MSEPYGLVVGDLKPEMEIDLSNQLGLLTGALSVDLEWYKPDATTENGFAASPVVVALTVVDAPTGLLKRTWVAGDSAIAGIHRGRVVITTAGNEPAHWPDDGEYIYWVIHQ